MIQLLISLLLIFFFQSVQAAGYWNDYRQCLIDLCPTNAVQCRTYATARSAQFNNLTANLAALNPGIPCQRGDSIFLGNGAIIDAKSCGPRPTSTGCNQVSPHLTPSDEPAPPRLASQCPFTQANDGSGSESVTWNASGSACTPAATCRLCGSRASAIETVSNSVSEGISGLLKCFAANGPFPHTSLRSAVVQSYNDLIGEGGLKLACPNDKVSTGRGHAAADAERSSRTINVYSGGLNATGSTFGHEFLHMTGHPHHAVDDYNSHLTHNNPQETHAHEGSGDSFHPATAENPNGLPNRYFDRVYSCQSLCFPNQLTSREQCERCQGYPSGTLSTSQRAKCARMIPLAQLAEMQKRQRHGEEEIKNMCETQYDNMQGDFLARINGLAPSHSGGYSRWGNRDSGGSYGVEGERAYYGIYMSFPDNPQSGASMMSFWNAEPPNNEESDRKEGARTPVEREAEEARLANWSGPALTITPRNVSFGQVWRRCQQAYADAFNQANNMVRDFPNDPINKAHLAQLQKKYYFGLEEFRMKRTCSKLEAVRAMQRACERTAGTDPDKRRVCRIGFSSGPIYNDSIRPMLRELKSKAQDWNCKAAQMADYAPGFGGVSQRVPTKTFANPGSCDADGAAVVEGNFSMAEATTYCNAPPKVRETFILGDMNVTAGP